MWISVHGDCMNCQRKLERCGGSFGVWKPHNLLRQSSTRRSGWIEHFILWTTNAPWWFLWWWRAQTTWTRTFATSLWSKGALAPFHWGRHLMVRKCSQTFLCVMRWRNLTCTSTASLFVWEIASYVWVSMCQDGMLCTVRVEETPELVRQASELVERVEVEEAQRWHSSGDSSCSWHHTSKQTSGLAWADFGGRRFAAPGMDFAIEATLAIWIAGCAHCVVHHGHWWFERRWENQISFCHWLWSQRRQSDSDTTADYCGANYAAAGRRHKRILGDHCHGGCSVGRHPHGIDHTPILVWFCDQPKCETAHPCQWSTNWWFAGYVADWGFCSFSSTGLADASCFEHSLAWGRWTTIGWRGWTHHFCNYAAARQRGVDQCLKSAKLWECHNGMQVMRRSAARQVVSSDDEQNPGKGPVSHVGEKVGKAHDDVAESDSISDLQEHLRHDGSRIWGHQPRFHCDPESPPLCTGSL